MIYVTMLHRITNCLMLAVEVTLIVISLATCLVKSWRKKAAFRNVPATIDRQQCSDWAKCRKHFRVVQPTATRFRKENKIFIRKDEAHHHRYCCERGKAEVWVIYEVMANKGGGCRVRRFELGAVLWLESFEVLERINRWNLKKWKLFQSCNFNLTRSR